MSKVRTLRLHKIKPYLVFDGARAPMKAGTHATRTRYVIITGPNAYKNSYALCVRVDFCRKKREALLAIHNGEVPESDVEYNKTITCTYDMMKRVFVVSPHQPLTTICKVVKPIA